MEKSKTTKQLYNQYVDKMYKAYCPAIKTVEISPGQYATYFPPLPWWLGLMLRVQQWVS